MLFSALEVIDKNYSEKRVRHAFGKEHQPCSHARPRVLIPFRHSMAENVASRSVPLGGG